VIPVPVRPDIPSSTNTSLQQQRDLSDEVSCFTSPGRKFPLSCDDSYCREAYLGKQERGCLRNTTTRLEAHSPKRTSYSTRSKVLSRGARATLTNTCTQIVNKTIEQPQPHIFRDILGESENCNVPHGRVAHLRQDPTKTLILYSIHAIS
jgi:hypothetical protein